MKRLKHSLEIGYRARFLPYAFVLMMGLFPMLLPAQSNIGIRVIDESAIPYMEFLPKADFDQRFPGQIKSDLADLDSGWYVIYIHEQLNYYFGPILLKSTGQDYLVQLTQIAEAAVEQRPDIQGYQLRLSYEPAAGFSGNAENSEGSTNESNGNSVGDEQQPSVPPQPSGFWGFIRRVFGF